MKKILTYFYSLTLVTSNSVILTSCNSQTTEKFEISKVSWLQEDHVAESVKVQFTGNGRASINRKDYSLFQFSSDISKKTIIDFLALEMFAYNNISIFIYDFSKTNSLINNYHISNNNLNSPTPMIEGNYLAVEYQGKIVVTDTPFKYEKY